MNAAGSAGCLWLALSALAAGANLTHKPELLLEGQWSSDIVLTESRLSYEQVMTNLEWGVGVAYGFIGLEYRPFTSFDALTRPTELHRDRYSADLELRPRLTERVLLLLSGNYYYGFTDYRTAWLDEYYTQSYQGIRGYKKAYPQGHSAGVG